MNSGQQKLGTHLGPDALRDAKIVEKLQELNYSVTDLGNVELGEIKDKTNEIYLKNLDHVVTACESLANAMQKIDTKEEFPLILGGDHSMTIGTLAGIAKKYSNLGVIWFDAHGDLNIADTSPSGNIHGMSLAASLGIGDERLTNIGGYAPKIQIENVILIGARDLDEGEINLIKDIGMKVYTMEDVNRLGMEQVISESVEYLKHCDGVHLSFDVDAMCPALTPGTGTRVPNGISHADGLIFLNELKESRMITSLEIVEVNPFLEEKGNQTALFTVDLMTALFRDAKTNEYEISQN